MVYTNEAIKLNYSINIILAICLLFYVSYSHSDLKETIYVLKIFCVAFILLQILLKTVVSHTALPFATFAAIINRGFNQEQHTKKSKTNYENPLLTESSSPIFKSRQKSKSKLASLSSIFFQSVASVILIHSTIILFGAYLVHQFDETFTLSLLLATLIFIRPLILFGSSAFLTFGEDWSWSNPCQVQGLFILFGAWIGAFVIPLDWDRSWQAWPLPCIFGSLSGELISSAFLLLRKFKKPKKLV